MAAFVEEIYEEDGPLEIMKIVESQQNFSATFVNSAPSSCSEENRQFLAQICI